MPDNARVERVRAVLFGGALVVAGCANAGLPRKAWTRMDVSDVQVYTPLSERRVHDLMIDFTRFRVVADALTSKRAARLQTKIFLFPDQRTFEQTLGRREVIGRFGKGEDAFYMAINVNAGHTAGREQLFHGYTLQLLSSTEGRFPTWYQVGMAELLSTMVFRDGGVEIGRIPDDKAAGVTSVGRWVAPEALFSGDVFWQREHLEHRLFGQAQAWVAAYHFQIGARAGTGALERYLAVVESGVDPVSAMPEAWGIDAHGFMQELRDLARAGRFAYVTIPQEHFEFPEVDIEEAHPLKISSTADQLVRLCWAIGCGDQTARLQEYAGQARRESR